MYLTSVTLIQPILLDPTNPTQRIVAGTGALGPGAAAQRVHETSLQGDFREYAAGRIRLVTTMASTQSVPITFKSLTRAQVYLLEVVWPGRLLLFRDTYGTRVFGSYLATGLQHIPRSSQGDVSDISLAFNRVTYLDTV